MTPESESPLQLTLPPDDYQCEAELAGANGHAVRLSGILHLEASLPPRLRLHGDVPLAGEPNPDGTVGYRFPQISEWPSLRVDLVNGRDVLLVDCKVTRFPSRATVDAAAAVLGLGGFRNPLHRTRRRNFDDDEPGLFDGMRIQISGCDAIIAPPPIAATSPPPQKREPDAPLTWSVMERLPRSVVASDNVARVECSWPCSFSVPNGYQHRVRFSPVIEVTLTEPVDLRKLATDWIEPLHRLIGLSTWRQEKITYLAVRPAAAKDQRHLQVFGSNITQQPYASDDNEVLRTRRAFQCWDTDDASLLDLLRGWQRAQHDRHPLVETLAAFMFLPAQEPRPRFLLLIQALEGLYGHEHADRIDARNTQQRERRRQVIEALNQCEHLEPGDRRFIKDNLPKRAVSSLEPALRYVVNILPVDLEPDLQALAITHQVIADNDNAKDWAAALRVVRNDLSHGTRTWDSDLLEPAAGILEKVARCHLMRTIGCREDDIAAFLHRPG